MTEFKKLFPGLLVLLILTSAFWGPALFAGKTIIHGDSLGHGLPLLDLQSRALHDFGRLLWSDEIYGGHALFAEGQGGFANPVNMIFAWIVTPLTGSIYAENLFHWFCMGFTGLGILLLCRTLNLGSAASCLGAIAGVFSLDTIAQAENLTVSGALMWVPWALWAMERWLARATIGTAMVLGIMIALEMYSGYPETLDGILLYMIAMVLVRLADGVVRRDWLADRRARLGTFALAVLIAIGLCAVQLLPELQLIGQSHRSKGITIPIQIPISAYFRGFLFTRALEGSVQYFPLVGSLFVTMLATSTLVLPTSRAIKGHMLGTSFLIMLGMGDDTWLFRFIYNHNLLPQLHYYRVLLVYINNACLTVGVLAAAGAEGLARWAAGRDRGHGPLRASAPARAVPLVLFVAVWAWAVWMLYVPDAPTLQLALAATGVLVIPLAIALRRPNAIPFMLAALVVGETAALRVNSYYFGDASLLRKPSSIVAIQSQPDWRDFKIYSESLAGAFATTPPSSPDLLRKMRRMFPSAAGLSNLLWDLHSMDGALALSLARRAAISQLLDDESFGRTTVPPGSRLIDMLGIRWIVFDAEARAGGLRTFWHEEPDSVWIMENPAARPRFQLFAGCRSVASIDEALSTVGALQTPTLIVEGSGQPEPCAPAAGSADPTTAAPARFTVLKARSTRYHVKLSADAPVWFFLADANYPGWKAYLDGKEQPIYSAQILGKAVAIPAGEHDLWIRFESRSFEWGLSITLATLASMTALCAAARRRSSRA